MAETPSQVNIQKVQTDMVITEGVGPLSAADVQQIVSLVLAQVRHAQSSDEQREKDVGIDNRVYPPHVR